MATLKGLYPNIFASALEIAYDNDGINSQRTVGDHHNQLVSLLVSKSPEMLARCEKYLASLTKAQIEEACNGEEADRKALLAAGPSELVLLLDEIFEKMC